MKKAVIYARYSSDRQNEQSIVGQVEVCTKWAKDNDLKILRTYQDEALTGKTDKRPGFQKMIKDARNEEFDYILVYKLDRFARNRYDSAIYKAQLKKHNVRVISAMENIADGPEGIILESVLEGMAEYYSANLSQNVTRGMQQRAELGKHLGGTPPLGYQIDKDKNYVIDETTAPIVRKVFEMYTGGETLKNICADLKSAGYKTARGSDFTTNSFQALLKNKKYIGVYESMGVEVPNAIPRIISDELFTSAQIKLQQNKRAPARSKGAVTFHLTGKLFCGTCGNNMVGDSGTSHTKTTHYYYTCIEKKRRHGCTKKTVRKEEIEQLLTDVTINRVLTDENIEHLAKKAFELHEKERANKSELAALRETLKETQKVIDNIMRAIEQGIITETTKQRLTEVEENKKTLLASIAKEEIEKPRITQESIEFFLRDIKNRIYDAEERIEVILKAFVNAVYLYDDRIVITFNLREGEELKKIELSELEAFGFGDATSTIEKETDFDKEICLFFSDINLFRDFRYVANILAEGELCSPTRYVLAHAICCLRQRDLYHIEFERSENISNLRSKYIARAVASISPKLLHLPHSSLFCLHFPDFMVYLP